MPPRSLDRARRLRPRQTPALALACALLALTWSGAASAQDAPAPDATASAHDATDAATGAGGERPRVGMGVDLLPYVGTSATHGLDAERDVSFNIIGGVSGGVRQFELSGCFGIVRGEVGGVQLAGCFNLAEGGLSGVQIAPINLTWGEVDGAQVGQVNVATADVDGAQVGQVNVVTGAVDGAQVGQVNVAADLAGAQVGVLNVSAGAVDGAQVGVLNVAAGGSDVQVGVLNVAADSDVSIGLVNIIWNGRTHLEVSGDEAGFVHLSLKHGGRYLHNIYEVGARTWGDARDAREEWSVGLGLGGHVPLTDDEALFVDLDLITRHVRDGWRHERRLHLINTARLLLGWRALPGVALLAGVSYNLLVSDQDDGARYAPWGSAHRAYDSGGERRCKCDGERWHLREWPGVVLGVQLF